MKTLRDWLGPALFLSVSALAQGPVMVKDLWPGSNWGVRFWRFNSMPPAFAHGSTLYFEGSDGVSGFELWRSDGTASGTYMIKDLQPGSTGSSPSWPVGLGGFMLFEAFSRQGGGNELWRTDGTAGGTVMIRSFSSDGSLRDLTEFQGRVYFSTRTQLWSTDGTTGGTAPVPGAPFTPYLLRACNQKFFVAATTGLWSYDGISFTLLPTFGWIRTMKEAAGLMWISTDVNQTTTELWVSDGTPAGTVLLRIWPLILFDFPKDFTAVTSSPTTRVVFSVRDPLLGFELGVSDGTPSGTTVLDLDPRGCGTFPCGINPFAPIALNGKVLFNGGPNSSQQLWSTDGTPAGTGLVSAVTIPASFARVGEREVWFSGYQVLADGVELFKTDGTAAGTFKLGDINPNGSSWPQGFTLVGGEVFFAADDGVNGIELWKATPGATSRPLGNPCGASWPTLQAGDPVLGASWSIDANGLTPGTTFWLLLSQEAQPSLLGSCSLHLDLPSSVIFGAGPVNAPSWSLSGLLPYLPQLTGLTVTLQGVQAPTAAALGGDLTNGIAATLGL